MAETIKFRSIDSDGNGSSFGRSRCGAKVKVWVYDLGLLV